MTKRSDYVDLNKQVLRDRKGNRITDDYVRHALEDIEDDSEPHPSNVELRPAGRPSLTAAGVSSPRLQLRVNVDLAERVKKIAKDKHTSVSSLVREALEDLVDDSDFIHEERSHRRRRRRTRDDEIEELREAVADLRRKFRRLGGVDHSAEESLDRIEGIVEDRFR